MKGTAPAPDTRGSGRRRRVGGEPRGQRPHRFRHRRIAGRCGEPSAARGLQRDVGDVEAGRWLELGEPDDALPHMRAALAAIQRARQAERLYLRGRPPTQVVDIGMPGSRATGRRPRDRPACLRRAGRRAGETRLASLGRRGGPLALRPPMPPTRCSCSGSRRSGAIPRSHRRRRARRCGCGRPGCHRGPAPGAGTRSLGEPRTARGFPPGARHRERLRVGDGTVRIGRLGQRAAGAVEHHRHHRPLHQHRRGAERRDRAARFARPGAVSIRLSHRAHAGAASPRSSGPTPAAGSSAAASCS